MPWLSRALSIISQGGRCVLVTVAQVKGSAPRETGAKMLVWQSGMIGSVGGGHLEFQAIAFAHRILASDTRAAIIETFSLGPDLNQCCGGQVSLLFEALNESARTWLGEWANVTHRGESCAVVLQCSGETVTRLFVTAEDLEFFGFPDFLHQPIQALLAGSRTVHVIRAEADTYVIQPAGERSDHVSLFGAGHVGKAIVRSLAPLRFRIAWIDSRNDAFPSDLPEQVEKHVCDSPAAEVARAPSGTFFLVMTHSHPLDLDICARVLERNDFAFLGLIGSETKRARFAGRLRAVGIPASTLARLTCPIGIPGIVGKEPATIAASVAAQLLIVAEHRRQAAGRPAARIVGSGR